MTPVEASSQVIGANLRPTFPDSINEKLRSIVSSCWENDPKSRPTFQQLLS